MIFHDKYYSTIHDGDRVQIDMEDCECINGDDIVECVVSYDYEKETMTLTAARDSMEFTFRYEPKKSIIWCIEKLVKVDGDEESLI